MRQAFHAVETKRQDDWDRLSFGLCWVVNMMPNFSKRRRKPIRLSQLNPFLKQRGRASGLTDDGLEKALDRMADRSNEHG